MGRNAFRKTEESAEPLLFGPTEVLHVIPAFRPADYGSYGNEQDVFQHMDSGTFDTCLGNSRFFHTFAHNYQFAYQ